MFKNHPKGLLAASLANMGERFGFYTMMAILVLFLQAKLGLGGVASGWIYSIFYFSIYAFAFIGGLIADKTRNYKGTIMVGIILMACGYAILGMPTPTPVANQMVMTIVVCLGLFTIAFGNGLFKGNLQALVGQMYDNPTYSKYRDSGFSLFYMFINIGAIFAPWVAPQIRSWWLAKHGFGFNPNLPALCHEHLGGTISTNASETFSKLANEVQLSGTPVTDLTQFSNEYLNVFTEGFHYSFIVAIFMMLISLTIYIKNKKQFPNPATKDKKAEGVANFEMSLAETKQRIWALIAVFGVAIFFWFSFHQNGLTMTFFARDYTRLVLFGKQITPEVFQSVNPFFVVFLTPVVMGLFGWLRARGMEPSTPKKIMIGMGIAAAGFAVMAIGSYVAGLPLFSAVKEAGESAIKVTPFLLIGTYVILTVAELFISPLGISFVSKVAPPKYQGIMQGGWLGATALGNQLLIIGAILYEQIPMWMLWTLFVTVCLISMFTMLFMVKWLERVSK